MARQISFILTHDNSICAFANGKAFAPVGKDHPNYQAIKEALAADDVAKLTQLIDIPKTVVAFAEKSEAAKGKVEVRDGVVFYNNEAVHSTLTDRILSLMRDQFPFEPMLKFLENLMLNPSCRAVDELYDFLANKALPITEDGCFLAYKHVRDDFKDIYSNKFDNSIGKVVEMPRNRVDDNREQGCSNGLHVGAIEYVKGYGGAGCDNGGKYIVCKVNPQDVVSVPKDHSYQKLRTCKYEVVGLYEGDLTQSLYTPTGNPSSMNDPDDEELDDLDGEFDDEDDYDEEDDFDDEEDEEDLDDDEEQEEHDASVQRKMDTPPVQVTMASDESVTVTTQPIPQSEGSGSFPQQPSGWADPRGPWWGNW